MLDLIGTLQRAVDAAAEFGTGIGRIEALVGIHRARGIGVGRNLPAREIDRRQARARLLHRLVAGHGTEGVHIRHGVERFPQTVGRPLGERIGDREGTAQLLDVRRGVGTGDTVETPGGRGNQLFKVLRHLKFSNRHS